MTKVRKFRFRGYDNPNEDGVENNFDEYPLTVGRVYETDQVDTYNTLPADMSLIDDTGEEIWADLTFFDEVFEEDSK